jgi:dihydrofolate reductase
MIDKEPKIVFVVAVSRNGVIGRDGVLPWRIPSDLKRFREITMGKPVIMGRRTWEGLPRRPLPGRENIVVTRSSNYEAPGAHVVQSIAEAVAKARTFKAEEIAVIGGGEVFREMMDRCDRLYLTEIDLVTDGDTFMPGIDPDDWRLVREERHAAGPSDSASFTLRVLDRIKGSEAER